jgi:hypothetical protein
MPILEPYLAQTHSGGKPESWFSAVSGQFLPLTFQELHSQPADTLYWTALNISKTVLN